MTREYYEKKRESYYPEKPRVVFVLESPPKSELYFYDNEGEPWESLFLAMMRYVLGGELPKTKEDGLKRFQQEGYLIVDATYVPVDGKTNRERNEQILSDIERLAEDLKAISKNGKVKIVLIKANVCRKLAQPLKDRGIEVENYADIINGDIIPFPSHGHQRKFVERIKKFL